MGMDRQKIVWCDDCSECEPDALGSFFGDPPVISRKVLRSRGWACAGNHDYCPKCVRIRAEDAEIAAAATVLHKHGRSK